MRQNFQREIGQPNRNKSSAQANIPMEAAFDLNKKEGSIHYRYPLLYYKIEIDYLEALAEPNL